MKSVAVKSEAQQAVLALHRMRQQLVKFRTAQINGLRGLLAEYGEVMPQGKRGIRKGISKALQCLADRLPAVLIDTLREQFERIGKLDAQVADIERRLRQWHQEDPASQRIAAIPGVGLLSATAAVATVGDQQAWRYLTLLIHGARSVLSHSKEPPQWATNLAKRRPHNVVVVALANKMARTIWALLAHDRAYQKGL